MTKTQQNNPPYEGVEGDVKAGGQFDPSKYTLRTKNFIPYYEKVLQILNLYDDYENLFIDPELKKKLSELNIKFGPQFSDINKKLGELNAELSDKRGSASNKFKSGIKSKIDELNKEWYSISPEYVELSSRIYKKRKLCEKAFLIRNGRMLLDCWFEDCDIDINGSAGGGADENEVNEYMNFLLKIWADFFLKYRKLTG